MTKDKGPSLFDDDEAKRRRDEAMAAVDAHASPALKAQWLDIIYEICKTKTFFTTDDVVRLGIARGVPEPPEGRLFGSLMKRAAASGWCRQTRGDMKSERVKLHHGNCRIWASNLASEAVVTCSCCKGLGMVSQTR